MHKLNLKFSGILLLFALFFYSCTDNNHNNDSEKQPLLIGWAIEDITPDGPVSLQGQYYERISEYVQSPLTATAFAIESVDESGKKEQSIMISLDVVSFKDALQDSLRSMLKGKIPGFDLNKIFLNATHTHSSFDTGLASKDRGMLLDKLSKVAVTAWENRQPGG